MKYLFCLIMVTAAFTACKKEEDRYCWQCTKTTDVTYVYMGVETNSQTKEDTSMCGLTEAEIRSFVSSNKLSFKGNYQGTDADYKSSVECTQQQ